MPLRHLESLFNLRIVEMKFERAPKDMSTTTPPARSSGAGQAFRRRARNTIALSATLALTLGMGVAGAQATATPVAAKPLLAAPAASGPIVADGIASNQIGSSGDILSTSRGKHVIAGHASIAGTGSPATVGSSSHPVPEGTPVYVQWQDSDGSVSPVYSAKTHDGLSGQFGGPGAYVFKLPSWTDAFGKVHYFTANGKQKYRLWMEPMTNPATGGEVTVFRAADGMTPNRFVKVANGDGALGAVTIAGTNVRNTALTMYEKPQQYMVSENFVEDTAGPVSDPSVQTAEKYTVSGTVWLETGAGDRSNSGTGPNKNLHLGDRAAEGYTVYVSMLNKQGAAANKAIKDLDPSKRAAETKRIVSALPDFIGTTVAAKTDANGNYTARIGEAFTDFGNMYTWVADPSGKVVSSYSSSTYPEFADYNANLLWTPQTAPALNPALHNLYNRNHAVIPFENANISVTNFNAIDKPAAPGDTAVLALEGNLTPLETVVTWQNAAGTELKKCENIASAQDVAACTLTVSKDLAKDDIYTATLWAADNPVSADSFAALAKGGNPGASAKADSNANASAAANSSTNANASSSSKANSSSNSNSNSSSASNASADQNASASASADSKANAAAKAAAMADSSTSASAKATASAQAAAKAAANPTASANASTKANAASKAAAQAAANHKGNSDTNASASSKANSNASAAAKSAAIANASSDASGFNPNPDAVTCLEPSKKSPFLDTPTNHNFFKEIDWMYCMKYTTGIKSEKGLIYGPQMRLSREAMAAFIFRMKADPSYKAPKVSPFADMKPGDKFYREIAWMYEEGLSTGIKQETGKPIYGPKLRLTREAMAAFIYRLEAANKGYVAPAESKMQDMKPGMKFYTEINWMVEEGLSTGIKVEGGNREYWPKSRLSREAMAAFIYRLTNEYRG